MQKIKAACLNCRKAFSGSPEKLTATNACPACGATGNWWGQIETRFIRKERIHAEQQAQVQGTPPPQWQPPPPMYGQRWAPLTYPSNRAVVLALGVVSVFLSPIGLITGPIGFLLSRKGYGEVKRGEVPQDTGFTIGWIFCAVGFFMSIFGVLYLWWMIEDFRNQQRERDEFRRRLQPYEQPRSPYGHTTDDWFQPRWR